MQTDRELNYNKEIMRQNRNTEKRRQGGILEMFEGGRSDEVAWVTGAIHALSLMPRLTINIIHHRPIISPLFLRPGGRDRLFENLSPNLTFERGVVRKKLCGGKKIVWETFWKLKENWVRNKFTVKCGLAPASVKWSIYRIKITLK